MSYKLTIIQKPTYVHAIVTGVNSLESVAGYLQEIHHECTTRKCFRVLIEERLEGPRLKIADVFQIVARGNLAGTNIVTIAYVDVNASGDLMKFAESVAVSRALPVKFFSSVQDAENWLLGIDRKAG